MLMSQYPQSSFLLLTWYAEFYFEPSSCGKVNQCDEYQSLVGTIWRGGGEGIYEGSSSIVLTDMEYCWLSVGCRQESIGLMAIMVEIFVVLCRTKLCFWFVIGSHTISKKYISRRNLTCTVLNPIACQ